MCNTYIDCAISPCPNDTFCFEDLLTQQNISKDFFFRAQFFDIDRLNQLALEGEFPIIKISAALYPRVRHEYIPLSSGAAFCKNAGPLVICKKGRTISLSDVTNLTVAIPGIYTSAYAAFLQLYGIPKKVVVVPYYMIAQSVALSEEIDIGILIHEARFTFQTTFDRELVSLVDLHTEYTQKYKLQLPLGLIVAHRCLGEKVLHIIDKSIQASIKNALSRGRCRVTPFIQDHAQELSIEAIEKHIDLYVTEETICMSSAAKQALKVFTTRCQLNETSFKMLKKHV